MESVVKKRSGKSKNSPPVTDATETLNSQTTKSRKKEREQPSETTSTNKFKSGSLGIKKEDQVWSRTVLMVGILVIVIVTKWRKTNEITWAAQTENIKIPKAQPLICSETYLEEISKFEGCQVKKCGRFVMDGLFAEEEVNALLNMFKKGLELGQSSGGASILDLHSGALSKGERFINIYNFPEGQNLWEENELATYREVKEKVRRALAKNFGIEAEAIHLTSPTFFSQMTTNPAKTVHDEYWHAHVDKETYETFHFTSLLYLSDYGLEFKGGRFVFVDGDRMNRTVEPRKGRVSMFTSGAENLHYVEKVSEGTRYALTIAFTCDAQHAISDPYLRSSHI